MLSVTLSLVAAMLTTGMAAPTVYLAGDSTMAKNGGGKGTEGWGQYLGYSLSIPVVNKAIAGRSARSYTREGRFTDIINTVKSGDFVVIEFGHNDGGSLTPTDNGRSNCGGDGPQTCQTTYNGVQETVLTFTAYLINAANAIKAKGATVIIASQTPNNPDEGGSFSYSPGRFVGLAQTAAKTSGVGYVDHGAYCAQSYKPLSVATVNSYFPNDHTHTAPVAADLVAKAFVKGLSCSNIALKGNIKNSTLPGNCI